MFVAIIFESTICIDNNSKFPRSRLNSDFLIVNLMLSKRKTPIKASYQYLIRAKLYGVITMNAIEGMMNELDELIPVEMERGMSQFCLYKY